MNFSFTIPLHVLYSASVYESVTFSVLYFSNKSELLKNTVTLILVFLSPATSESFFSSYVQSFSVFCSFLLSPFFMVHSSFISSVRCSSEFYCSSLSSSAVVYSSSIRFTNSCSFTVHFTSSDSSYIFLSHCTSLDNITFSFLDLGHDACYMHDCVCIQEIYIFFVDRQSLVLLLCSKSC